MAVTRRALVKGAAAAALIGPGAIAAAPDPMLALVERYYRQVARLEAVANEPDDIADAELWVLSDIEDEIASTAALTAAGAIAKLGVVERDVRIEINNAGEPDGQQTLILSALADARRFLA